MAAIQLFFPEPNRRSGVLLTMTSAFFQDDDAVKEPSADQREMVRLVRCVRLEVNQRIKDIGCMNPGEIEDFLNSLDLLIDLHIYAHSLDDRLESTRNRLSRSSWND